MNWFGKTMVISGWAVFALFNIVDLREHGFRDPPGPGDVLKQYVSALRSENYDRAMDCLLLTPSSQPRDALRLMLPELAGKMNRGDWDVEIVDNAQAGRFAALLYSTRKGRVDVEPILLVRDGADDWKLYHQNTAGGLNQVAMSAQDLADANSMIGWGRTRMRERGAGMSSEPGG